MTDKGERKSEGRQQFTRQQLTRQQNLDKKPQQEACLQEAVHSEAPVRAAREEEVPLEGRARGRAHRAHVGSELGPDGGLELEGGVAGQDCDRKRLLDFRVLGF